IDGRSRQQSGCCSGEAQGRQLEASTMAPRRIFTPSLGPSSWRAFLADSFAHWRRGKSAWELAVAWEAAARSRSGVPAEVTQALATSPTFRDVELIAAIPEHRVT